MNFVADDVLIAGLLHLDEVHYPVIQPDQDFLGGPVVVHTDGLLRIPLGPYFHELIAREVTLPGFNAANLHKFSALILPRHLGISHLGVELVDWALIRSGDEEKVLIIEVDVISNPLALPLDCELQVQLGRIYHHFRCVLVELQELLDQFRVH